MKTDILGVKIDDVNMEQALAQIEKWVCPDGILHRGSRTNGIRRENPGKHYVVTPNPEMVVAAQRDELFKKVLNDADLSIPDGIGLKLSGRIKNTFAGTDLMEQLISLSSEKGFTVGFLGGRDGIAKKCSECLLKKYPGLKVVFAKSGGEVDKNGNMLSDYRLPTTAKSNLATATEEDGRLKSVDILFVAFGHIKQEKWIANNLPNIPVHVGMGVGGAFDYLSDSVPRAPKWFRSLGFEWLFRLIVQPTRIKRQLVLFKYLWLLLVNK